MLVLLLPCPGKAWKEECTSKPLPWHAALLDAQLLENTWGFNESDMGSVCTEARHKNCLKAPCAPTYTISGPLWREVGQC